MGPISEIGWGGVRVKSLLLPPSEPPADLNCWQFPLRARAAGGGKRLCSLPPLICQVNESPGKGGTCKVSLCPAAIQQGSTALRVTHLLSSSWWLTLSAPPTLRAPRPYALVAVLPTSVLSPLQSLGPVEGGI